MSLRIPVPGPGEQEADPSGIHSVTVLVTDSDPSYMIAAMVMKLKLTRAQVVALASEALRILDDPRFQPDDFWLLIEDSRNAIGA